MKRINHPLILSDFDNTITNKQGIITGEVRDAINEYVAAGGIFCVITGRMLPAILPRVEEIGLKGLVAAYQGSMIVDLSTGIVLRENTMSMDECLDICRRLEKIGRKINYYADEKLYTDWEKGDPQLESYCRATATEPHCMEDGVKLSDYIKETGLRARKVITLVRKEERDEVFAMFKDMFGKDYDVTVSATTLVELSPKSDNKGTALEYIANFYGVPVSETVAVGDSFNDLPMIKKAGVGIAVKNAEPEVVKAAAAVTVSCDEGAVARVIRDYGFKED
ncbi:MAG: Cof-type HAD-IIB family hydrolase [Clostridia bacterium]|nr:Cof-type HAD-IIB family hydrolase [Clostridia bacterium]